MNNDRQELLPCPFCGEKRQSMLEIIPDNDVCCCNCYAHGPVCDVGKTTPAEHWNTRQALTAGLPDIEFLRKHLQRLYNGLCKLGIGELNKPFPSSWLTIQSHLQDCAAITPAGAPEEHVNKTPENIHDGADMHKEQGNLYTSQPTAGAVGAAHDAAWKYVRNCTHTSWEDEGVETDTLTNIIQQAMDAAVLQSDTERRKWKRWCEHAEAKAAAVAEKCGALVEALEQFFTVIDTDYGDEPTDYDRQFKDMADAEIRMRRALAASTAVGTR